MAKRFYDCAEARTYSPSGAGNPNETDFAIYLDDSLLRTPAKAPLLVPHKGLAEAIAAEWQAQGEEIKPDTMAFMRFAATAIDRITPDPTPTIKEFIGFGQTDLLAFRATNPDNLVAKQAALWNPPLAWAAQTYAIVIEPTQTLKTPAPSEEALAQAATQQPFRLAGLVYGAALLGSAVLTLALADGFMDASTAFEAGFLDDIFQQDYWGQDSEAQARLDKIRLEIETLAVYSAYIREA
ncbi:MAG: ATPase [Alphaproteobacteria bacterium]|nr:ATPase [Alphaproteobacteria bacterium]